MSKSIDFKISLDHDNLLISRGNKSFIVKGHYIDDLVGVILESNIKAFKKSDNFKDLIIEYDNNQGQIILQNYNLLFKYAEFSQVKKQYETYKNNNLNKITKTNKHVGKRIAITATLVTILSL